MIHVERQGMEMDRTTDAEVFHSDVLQRRYPNHRCSDQHSDQHSGHLQLHSHQSDTAAQTTTNGRHMERETDLPVASDLECRRSVMTCDVQRTGGQKHLQQHGVCHRRGLASEQ